MSDTTKTAAGILTLIGKHSRTEQLAIINGVRVILGDIELDESDESAEDEDDDQESEDEDDDEGFDEDEDEDEEEPKSVADALVAAKKSKSNAPTLESVLAILKQHPDGLRKSEILAEIGVESNGKPLGNMYTQQFKDWKARGHITLTNADGHPSATRWIATGKE
jgi:hypothetical protein